MLVAGIRRRSTRFDLNYDPAVPPPRRQKKQQLAAVPEAALLRVSKGTKKTVDLFLEGVYLAGTSAGGLEDLRHRACADRLRLAEQFVSSGRRLLRARPAQYRDAISRNYYGMYHATRAVVFYRYGGDDHESHQALPGQIPKDFPDAAQWTNTLKDARAHRNAADYDPYPTDVQYWRGVAQGLAVEAPTLLALVRQYLAAKGCNHL
ncbi:HEPN domain-containing protein [Micromonospora chokoriensis]|uniref:HEPN domain-containing protein n=1 Tax=Micromonospora chokoriensis TaxID=356851 RepID=UPI000A01F0A3